MGRMENGQPNGSLPGPGRLALLYHFCRLQLPGVPLPLPIFADHLRRCFGLFQAKRAREGAAVSWDAYLENLHAVDWYLCCGCLERQERAWECLFAARASRADCLLTDALTARAVRMYPRDEERQNDAVSDFWGYLLAGEQNGAVPILARYDGQ